MLKLVALSAMFAQLSLGQVSTVVGNGAPGFADGSATGPRLMYPEGIAVDGASGDLIVADSASQRIRRINTDGSLSTLAGSGPTLPSGLDVAGGYKDGPAAQAQFNHPTAAAFDRDGSVLVADSFNHCVRRIFQGRVTTVAGNPRTRGATDGDLSTATFEEPRGIAVDSSGTMYIADYGNGVRIISGSRVSTLSKTVDKSDPSASEIPGGLKGVESVSVLESAGVKTLFFSTSAAIFRRQLPQGSSEMFIDPDPYDPMPFFTGVAALSSTEVAVTSSLWSCVYIISFACKGSTQCMRVLAGGDDEDSTQAGGFADGDLKNSRFFTPTGIALRKARNLFVTDSGNRRVRAIVF